MAHSQPGIEFFDPPSSSIRPSYAHAAGISSPFRLVYTAGQVGRFQDGNHATGFEAQCKLAFMNLKNALEAAGASVKDVIKLTLYVVDVEANKGAMSPIMMKFLTDEVGKVHRAPATVVGVAALFEKNFLFEVEATAVVASI